MVHVSMVVGTEENRTHLNSRCVYCPIVNSTSRLSVRRRKFCGSRIIHQCTPPEDELTAGRP